jgi:hypothetical protein
MIELTRRKYGSERLAHRWGIFPKVLTLALLDHNLIHYQFIVAMKTLFDPAVKQELIRRVESVTEKSKGQWGKMTVDQMVSHINQSLAYPLGDISVKMNGEPGLQAKILTLFTLSPIPIPKAKAETFPEYKREGKYDLKAEKAKFRGLMERIVLKDQNAAWPPSPVFGHLNGERYGKILYKHADHHLKQFGA